MCTHSVLYSVGFSSCPCLLRPETGCTFLEYRSVSVLVFGRVHIVVQYSRHYTLSVERNFDTGAFPLDPDIVRFVFDALCLLFVPVLSKCLSFPPLNWFLDMVHCTWS